MKIMEDIKQLLTATKVKWALEDHRAKLKYMEEYFITTNERIEQLVNITSSLNHNYVVDQLNKEFKKGQTLDKSKEVDIIKDAIDIGSRIKKGIKKS